jgi:hypothetical protein
MRLTTNSNTKYFKADEAKETNSKKNFDANSSLQS